MQFDSQVINSGNRTISQYYIVLHPIISMHFVLQYLQYSCSLVFVEIRNTINLDHMIQIVLYLLLMNIVVS